jgi:hypothetical protein
MKASPTKSTVGKGGHSLQKPVIDIHITQEQKQMESSDSNSPLKVSEDVDNSLYEQIGNMNANFKHQSEKLVQKLNEKSKEIENLCILLESLTPVPGLHPEKFMKLIVEGDTSDIDYRDSKIVELAKKCRRLQVALNKERSEEITNQMKIQELSNRNEVLLKQIDSLSSSSTKDIVHEISSEERDQLQREVGLANKQIEELKRKLSTANDDLKRQQKILQKEVGDTVNVNQLSDEGWKGRAQQIVMLVRSCRLLTYMYENESYYIVTCL